VAIDALILAEAVECEALAVLATRDRRSDEEGAAVRSRGVDRRRRARPASNG
jgi:hypothetical protein